MTASCDRIGELEANNVIFVEAVSLERVYNDCRLLLCFKVCETEMHFMTFFCLAGHQPQLFEPRIRSENVSHFALGCISGQTFNVNSPSDVFGVL